MTILSTFSFGKSSVDVKIFFSTKMSSSFIKVLPTWSIGINKKVSSKLLDFIKITFTIK